MSRSRFLSRLRLKSLTDAPDQVGKPPRQGRIFYPFDPARQLPSLTFKSRRASRVVGAETVRVAP